MIIELMLIIVCEIIVLLGILIVYCADYTNTYLHCHQSTEPVKHTPARLYPNYNLPKEKVCEHYYHLGKKELNEEKVDSDD